MTLAEFQPNSDQAILILAPTGRDSELTARVFRDYRLHAEVCAGPKELGKRLSGSAGLAFLTEEALTPELVQILVKSLEQQPTWSDIPLVILTSAAGETQANAEALATLVELEVPVGSALTSRPIAPDVAA